METLIKKYSTDGPRYTSYPTVPHWETKNHNEENWTNSMVQSFVQSGGELSLYIHLPFCESLCTYCGCTTHITKNHSIEETYISYLLKEWDLYLQTFPFRPILKEIHLGGGTPTFFSPENLKTLIEGIVSKVDLDENFEAGFEGHPGNTSAKHLKVLSNLGFNRLSLGIQDFNPLVQQTINRYQSVQQVADIMNAANTHGFKSINFDLIYGLPKQNLATIKETISKVIDMFPGRIAYYGYAHVPWIKKAQTSFEQHLPSPSERLEMYLLGKELLTSNGYIDIGMDHFALPGDPLLDAFQKGTLHRNFMGYTTQATKLMVGLGMSAIGDSWTVFNQNEKSIKKYFAAIDDNRLPILRGHQLTIEDLIIRKHILNLMCQFKTSWTCFEKQLKINEELLSELELDGLIRIQNNELSVTDSGKPFIRNICMAFDSKLWKSRSTAKFSQTV